MESRQSFPAARCYERLSVLGIGGTALTLTATTATAASQRKSMPRRSGLRPGEGDYRARRRWSASHGREATWR